MKHITGYLTAVVILVIMAACIIPGSASSGYFWSKNAYLYQGQAASYNFV